MAVGFAVGVANSILNSIFRNAAWTPPAGTFLQCTTCPLPLIQHQRGRDHAVRVVRTTT